MNDLRMTSEVGKIRLRGGRHTINATRFEQNTPPRYGDDDREETPKSLYYYRNEQSEIRRVNNTYKDSLYGV